MWEGINISNTLIGISCTRAHMQSVGRDKYREEIINIKSRFEGYLNDISGKNSKEIYSTMYNTMIAEKETISLFTFVNENWEGELKTSRYGNFIYDILQGVVEEIDLILTRSK